MTISDKLAFEIYTISLFHMIAILFISGFTFYIYLLSKKTPLLFSYLRVVAMLLIWMVSKLFKTLSPTEALRWFFIVTQYIGIDFIGYFLIQFAFLYTRNRPIERLPKYLLAIVPILSFLAVATNPMHMLFYSYYDFYRDSFGLLFYPSQLIHYLYLFSGIFLLSKNFFQQPSFRGKKVLGQFFALLILIPVFGNIYYLLVKLTDVPWIFTFPFFDFTPITSSMALIFFMIPAIKYRFFDILGIAHRHIYDQLPTGIACCSKKGMMLHFNRSFLNYFQVPCKSISYFDFANSLAFLNEEDNVRFINFINPVNTSSQPFILKLNNQRSFSVTQKVSSSKKTLFFNDITAQTQLVYTLEVQNKTLTAAHYKLQGLSQSAKQLSQTRIQSKIAQDIHDILGHSLTVVIVTADVTGKSTTKEEADIKLAQIKELLMSSLADLKNSLEGKSLDLDHTSLIRAIRALHNETIRMDFCVQGTPIELDTQKTETIFRIFQEAMTNSIKHGHAKNLYAILRFEVNEIDLFLIDDGIGCDKITKNVGLTGMEKRIQQLKGKITFGSNTDRESSTGFHIHAWIPTEIAYKSKTENHNSIQFDF